MFPGGKLSIFISSLPLSNFLYFRPLFSSSSYRSVSKLNIDNLHLTRKRRVAKSGRVINQFFNCVGAFTSLQIANIIKMEIDFQVLVSLSGTLYLSLSVCVSAPSVDIEPWSQLEWMCPNSFKFQIIFSSTLCPTDETTHAFATYPSICIRSCLLFQFRS